MADTGNYQARTANIRETAKWIAAVFAAAGAVLFSGLSFTNLQQLAKSPQWMVSVALAAVPVLAAAWAVREAAAVFTTSPPGVSAVLPRFAVAHATGSPPIQTLDSVEIEKIELNLPGTVAVHGDISKFEDRLLDTRDRITRAKNAFAKEKTAQRQADLVGWPGGISPPGSHRTVRDSLPSHGS